MFSRGGDLKTEFSQSHGQRFNQSCLCCETLIQSLGAESPGSLLVGEPSLCPLAGRASRKLHLWDAPRRACAPLPVAGPDFSPASSMVIVSMMTADFCGLVQGILKPRKVCGTFTTATRGSECGGTWAGTKVGLPDRSGHGLLQSVKKSILGTHTKEDLRHRGKISWKGVQG